MTIARDLGFEVEVGNILRSDLYIAEEMFLSGTAAEVVPVHSVDDRAIGVPRPDDHGASRTSTAKAVRGEVDRYKDWIEHVTLTPQRCRVSVEIYDTTLRDGAQLEGISLTVDDKLRIAEQLDWLGVHYIEGGWPGANPKDDEFFRRAATELDLDTSARWWRSARPGASSRARSTTTTRCATWSRRAPSTVCIVGKCWDYHVTEALRDDARRGRGHGGRLGRVPARRTGSRCCSTPSTSSTATSATPSSACACSRPRPMQGADDARAVRHQRRLAARTRSRQSSARSSTTSATT